MNIRSVLRKGGAVVTAVAALAALSACSSSGGGGEKSLRVWWYENPGQPNVFGMQAALDQFKKDHPDVKVVFEQKTFDQMQQSGKQILASSSAPDVLEYNKGNATLGVAAKANLLTDLTQVAKDKGWTDKLGDATVSIGKVNLETGLSGIDGNLYGVPIGGEFVRVFYNKAMLSKAGIEVPKTFDEFQSTMDKFVSQGITPISLGAGDYPTVHLMWELTLVKATPAWVSDYQGLKKEIDFRSDPALAFGAKTAAEWLQKGYISKKATGVNASDMVNDFVNQKMPFMISGTWQNQLVESGAKGKFEWGTFLLPGSGIHEGAPTNIFVVPTNSKNKDLAYDYINTAVSEGPQTKIGNTGGVPVAGNSSVITNPIGQEATTQYLELAKSNHLGQFPDFPAAGYYDQLLAAGQDLLARQSTPEQYLQAIEKPYNAAVSAHAASK